MCMKGLTIFIILSIIFIVKCEEDSTEFSSSTESIDTETSTAMQEFSTVSNLYRPTIKFDFKFNCTNSNCTEYLCTNKTNIFAFQKSINKFLCGKFSLNCEVLIENKTCDDNMSSTLSTTSTTLTTSKTLITTKTTATTTTTTTETTTATTPTTATTTTTTTETITATTPTTATTTTTTTETTTATTPTTTPTTTTATTLTTTPTTTPTPTPTSTTTTTTQINKCVQESKNIYYSLQLKPSCQSDIDEIKKKFQNYTVELAQNLSEWTTDLEMILEENGLKIFHH